MWTHEPARKRSAARQARLGRLRAGLSQDGGGIAVYAALIVPLFVGAAGLAVDVASWYRAKRTMQTAADAAAYAAALDLAAGGLQNGPDLAALQLVANDAASRNGVTTPVVLNVPPTSGLAAGDPQSIEVIATEPAPLYFTGMFLGGGAPAIGARAVAKAVVSDACVWALHPDARGALTVAGSTSVTLGCGVVVNSTHEEAALEQTGASCLTATSVAVRGDYAGNCVVPDPEVFAPDYGDPLATLEAPTVGTCDFPNPVVVDGAATKQHGGGPVPLYPGVYCGGIQIKANQTAIFEPGLYVLDGGTFYIAGNATVSNDTNASGGVTFFLTGSGSDWAEVVIESGARVDLTPMTVPPLENVLFMQDRAAPAGGSFSLAGGADMNLEGILYFPTGHAEFTGGSTVDRARVLLVASTITFTGNSEFDADYARSLLPQAHFARFVE